MLILVLCKILFIRQKMRGWCHHLPGPRPGQGVEEQQYCREKSCYAAPRGSSYVAPRECVCHSSGRQQGGPTTTVSEAPPAREQQHVTLAPPRAKTEFNQKLAFWKTGGSRTRSDTAVGKESKKS